MIVVRIEMWPGGYATNKQEIGRTYIHNVSNLAPISNYEGWVCRRGFYEPVRQSRERATRTIQVKDYPRERYNVWRLVARALLSAFPEERDPLGPISKTLDLPKTATLQQILEAIQTLKGSARLDQGVNQGLEPGHLEIPHFDFSEDEEGQTDIEDQCEPQNE